MANHRADVDGKERGCRALVDDEAACACNEAAFRGNLVLVLASGTGLVQPRLVVHQLEERHRLQYEKNRFAIFQEWVLALTLLLPSVEVYAFEVDICNQDILFYAVYATFLLPSQMAVFLLRSGFCKEIYIVISCHINCK